MFFFNAGIIKIRKPGDDELGECRFYLILSLKGFFSQKDVKLLKNDILLARRRVSRVDDREHHIPAQLLFSLDCDIKKSCSFSVVVL